jgi:thiamine biosynthesis protein ThiI
MALPGIKVKREWGRIWLCGSLDAERLRKVFGIVSFSEVEHCKLEELNSFLLDFRDRVGLREAKTFALRLRRVGNHAFKSQDKTVELADLILARFENLGVNLGSPEAVVYVEIRHYDCYL